MRWFKPVFAVFGALACSLSSGRAAAVLLLDGADQPARIERVWAAVAVAPEQSTTWMAIGTRSAGRFGVVIPLRDGTQLDFSDREWLDALELATAPRILPPEETTLPGCAPDEPAVEIATDPLPEVTLDPVELVFMATLDDLDQVATDHALGFSDAQAQAAAQVPSEQGALLLVYDATRDESVTRPVRVLRHGSEASVPFGSLRSGVGHDFGVTYFALGQAPLVLGEVESVAADELDVRWHAASGASDYAVARETHLRESASPRVVVEPTASQILYDWETLPDEAGVVRSIARYYLEKLAEPQRVDGCLANVSAVRLGGLAVARICAPGALATADEVAEPSCGETSELEPVDPSVLECGGADELAFAHAGLKPDVVVTRLVTRTTSSAPPEVSLFVGERGSDTTVVRADTIDDGGCDPTTGADAVGGSGWIPAEVIVVPGTTPVGGAPGVYEEECDYTGHDFYWDTTLVVQDDGSSCSGSTAPDDDYDGETCSSDSSGSDGCSSDTDDGYDGETCSGDGSGDGCSGESSDSGYSGETCGGSTDSGYSGETCSGDCSVSRHRRPRLSALVFTLCGLLVALRRASRPPRRDRQSGSHRVMQTIPSASPARPLPRRGLGRSRAGLSRPFSRA